MSAMMGLAESIGRRGKNHPIQSANASVIKIAMGSGYDPDGKPFLWHILPKYKARLIKMVHDEIVVSVPQVYAEKVAEEIQDSFRRAAKTRMSSVTMESEFNIGATWSK